MTNLTPASLSVRNEVKKFLEIHAIPGSHLLVAVSGGFDSLALCHIVEDLRQELGFTLSTLTVDHALQETSELWTSSTIDRLRKFGISQSTSLKVTVNVNSADGLEAAARSARHEALQSHASEIGADAILLAHTLDDQAETVLMRIAQGASTKSLAAMRPIQGNLWRPLLNVRREALRTYLDNAEIEAIDDPHNYDRRFTRVQVRHELLPVLRAVLGKDVVNSLATTAYLAAIDSDTLDALANMRYPNVVISNEILCERLQEDLPAIQHRLVYHWLTEQKSPRFSHEHVQSVLRLALENNLKGPLRVPGFEIHKASGTLRAVRSTDG